MTVELTLTVTLAGQQMKDFSYKSRLWVQCLSWRTFPVLVPLQDCIICMEKLSMVSGYSDVTNSMTIGPVAVGRLTKCSHAFHLLCLLAMYCNGNKVPTC